MFDKLKKIFSKEEKQKTKELHFGNKVFLDEEFASKFVASDGFFTYVENQSNALQTLKNIIEVEQIDTILSFETNLLGDIRLVSNTLATESLTHAKHSAMYISCEGLNSYDGSILISSDQIKHYKLDQLPKTIIVKANTNQFLKNASEGLELIRRYKSNQIPSNITSIKGSIGNEITNEKIVKKIFLILVESET